MKYKYNNQWKDLNVKVSDTYPIGAIAPYGGETAPANWLVCDGSAVSRTTYADLFSVIGTSFGSGDGSTTFNLPDLRSKVPLGKDNRDEDFDTIGETYGEKEHTLTIDEMPSHNHSITGSYNSENGLNQPSLNNGLGTSGVASYASSIGDTGGSQAHNIVQPSLVTNYIIKAFQSAGVVGDVAQTYTESDTDTYCCNYVNALTYDTGWQEIIPIEGTVRYPFQIRKIGKIVNMRGSITGVSGTTQIATIPEQFRSSQEQLMFAVTNSRLQLNSNGELYTLEASGTIGINCTWFVD